ncbi:MAG: MBL fold metallo-hydrolase [Halobacteriota archaeon]|nr:MBL fold metallo-hydrolase [Halobacteriota archaeon]
MTTSEKKPNIVELKPDIYLIRAGRPGSHVYLIKGQEKNVLIDTGMAANFHNLKKRLSEVGLNPCDIHLIILTHEHFDHIGATAFFFETAVVAAHRLAANKIELQDEFVISSKYFDVAAKPFSADIWLEEGNIIDLGNYRLRVLHTPGHCSGCISLYEPDHKLLFTGDTVLAGGTLSGIFASGSISDYMDSVQRLSALRIEEFYPGHGRISTNPEEDMQKAVKDSRSLLEESKLLFEALDTKATFQSLFTAARKTPSPKR